MRSGRAFLAILLALSACRADPYLALMFAGEDQQALRTYMQGAIDELNHDVGCQLFVAVDEPQPFYIKVIIDQAVLDEYGAKQDANFVGMYRPKPSPTVVLSPFGAPDRVIGGEVAYHGVAIAQQIFLHELGHALGLRHQEQGIMRPSIDPDMKMVDAAQSLADTLDALGKNPCKGPSDEESRRAVSRPVDGYQQPLEGRRLRPTGHGTDASPWNCAESGDSD